LQTIHPALGENLLAALQTPQPPPIETLLTSLLDEISALPDDLILVLDDYHLLASKAVDVALTFLVDHQPPQLRLVISSRENPPLPLARLRVRNQLIELVRQTCALPPLKPPATRAWNVISRPPTMAGISLKVARITPASAVQKAQSCRRASKQSPHHVKAQ
jgi:hypothetical protein